MLDLALAAFSAALDPLGPALSFVLLAVFFDLAPAGESTGFCEVSFFFLGFFGFESFGVLSLATVEGIATETAADGDDTVGTSEAFVGRAAVKCGAGAGTAPKEDASLELNKPCRGSCSRLTWLPKSMGSSKKEDEIALSLEPLGASKSCGC